MDPVSRTPNKSFLESLLGHPGAADAEVKAYLARCLELEAIAISAASKATRGLLRIVNAPTSPAVVNDPEVRRLLRLLAAHLYDLVLTIGQAAKEGRVTVGFSLMRIAEDSLDLLVGIGCVPGVANAYARFENPIKPSEAAKKFERYLEASNPQRAEAWARSRRQLRDALNPLAHVSYIAIQQTVRGVVKEIEERNAPVHIAKVGEPVARVYKYLYGLSYSVLEGLQYIYPEDDSLHASFSEIEAQLPRYFAVVHELKMTG